MLSFSAAHNQFSSRKNDYPDIIQMPAFPHEPNCMGSPPTSLIPQQANYPKLYVRKRTATPILE